MISEVSGFPSRNSTEETNSRSKTTDFTDFTYRSPHGPEEAVERPESQGRGGAAISADFRANGRPRIRTAERVRARTQGGVS